jgi:hypothetical protein
MAVTPFLAQLGGKIGKMLESNDMKVWGAEELGVSVCLCGVCVLCCCVRTRDEKRQRCARVSVRLIVIHI